MIIFLVIWVIHKVYIFLTLEKSYTKLLTFLHTLANRDLTIFTRSKIGPINSCVVKVCHHRVSTYLLFTMSKESGTCHCSELDL